MRQLTKIVFKQGNFVGCFFSAMCLQYSFAFILSLTYFIYIEINMLTLEHPDLVLGYAHT